MLSMFAERHFFDVISVWLHKRFVTMNDQKKKSKHSPNKERLRHCGCYKETDNGSKNEPEMSRTDNTNLPFRREKRRWAEKCSRGIWKREMLFLSVIVGLP